jgi:cysteine desulfurase
MTLNGGKVYGPKGTGVLFVCRGVTLEPVIRGGGQERGLRSGTENVPGIVGFAHALALAQHMREKESARLSLLRDEFFKKLKQVAPDVVVNGGMENRLPNNINIAIPHTDSGELVARFDAKGIAVSARSACGAYDEAPSHVIMAIHRESHFGNVRITLGRGTRKRDLEYVLKVLPDVIKKSSVYDL